MNLVTLTICQKKLELQTRLNSNKNEVKHLSTLSN